MASIFGDDGVDDLLNNDLVPTDDLPSDNENLFGENGDGEQNDEGGLGTADSKGVKVEPKKRAVRNPRPRLTVETLRGPRGIQTIEDYCKDVKFKGKGYEKHDLDEVMRRLQHWAHRMYPNYKFEDVLTNIERLGKKKPLQVHMSRYRLGMLEQAKLAGAGEHENFFDNDDDIAGGNGAAADEPFDEFDALLGEQIAISKLAPRTPAPPSNRHAGRSFANTSISSSTFATPSFSRAHAAMSTPYSTTGGANGAPQYDNEVLAEPLPPSQPTSPAKKLSAEQIARIAENRRLAQERLRAKKALLQQAQQTPPAPE